MKIDVCIDEMTGSFEFTTKDGKTRREEIHARMPSVTIDLDTMDDEDLMWGIRYFLTGYMKRGVENYTELAEAGYNMDRWNPPGRGFFIYRPETDTTERFEVGSGEPIPDWLEREEFVEKSKE